MVKLGIEVGIGICTKCTAEYTKRGEGFSKVRARGWQRGWCWCRSAGLQAHAERWVRQGSEAE
jgi:hypothetical protein